MTKLGGSGSYGGAWLLLLLVSACSADEAGSAAEYIRRADGGALDASAATGLCTRTPEEWLATCDGDEPRSCGRGHGRHHPRTRGRGHACDSGPSRVECRALGSTNPRARELAALAVNERVNDDLSDLHFSSGYRRELAVDDVLDGESCELIDVIDANRAFAGCIDRGVLVPWIETPVCVGTPSRRDREDRGRDRDRDRDRDRGGPAEGPAGNPCLGFDTGCTRGRLDEVHGCCTAELLPAGTVCDQEGAMLCDGSGGCVDAERVPESERVAAPSDWVALFSDGLPASGFLPTEVAEVVPVASAPLGMPAASLEIRAPLFPEGAEEIDEVVYPVTPDGPEAAAEPAAAAPPPPPTDAPIPTLRVPRVLAIVPASLQEQSRVTVVASARSAAINAVAYDGPSVPHALVLTPREGETLSQVFVVRGRIDTLPAIYTDGSSGGATRITCSPPGDPIPFPSAAAAPELRCDLDLTGRAVIVGVDVSLVWADTLPPGPYQTVGGPLPGGFIGGRGDRGDFLPRSPGSGVGGFCAGTTSCTAPGGCPGVRLCFGGSSAGRPCVVGIPETCDGVDNNCNGSVDEGAQSSCDDGIGCTRDRCRSGSCRNTPQPFFACVSRSACETGVCTDATATAFSSRPITPGDPPAPAAPGAPTGCSVVLGNSWCRDSFDGCDCNGPEICDPTFNSGIAGCATPPVAFAGATGLTVTDPCDRDGAACTIDRFCCEPLDYSCVTDRALAATETGRQLLNLRVGICDNPLGGSNETFDGLTDPATGLTFPTGATVRCSITPPFEQTLPRCPNDGNPCTIEGCNPATGACLAPVLVGAGGSVGIGEVFPNPSFDPFRPFITGSTCAGRDPDDRCGVFRCNGTGGCVTGSANTTLPTYTTTECQGRLGDGLCLALECTNGPVVPGAVRTVTCGATRPTDAFCQFPQGSCGPTGVGVCAGSFLPPPSPEGVDVPLGCRPPEDRCYLAGTPGNGVADGSCVPIGAPDPLDPCRVCTPDANPWGYTFRTDPAPCDDGNPCTTGETCQPGTGCGGGGALVAGTLCDDGLDCSFSEECDGAGACIPLECSEVCIAPNCPEG